MAGPTDPAAPASPTTGLTLDLLQKLLQQEQRLRFAAEARAAAARRALEQALEDLAPEVVDRQRRADPDGLAPLSEAALGAQLRHSVRTQVAHLNAQIAVLSGRATPQVPTQIPRQHPAPLPPPVPAALPPPSPAPEAEELDPTAVVIAAPENTWPAWFRAWHSAPGFASQATLVTYLGQTGEPERARLDKQIGMAKSTLHRAIKQLTKTTPLLGLTVIERGRWKAHLLQLTPRGLDAYRLLTGEEPVTPQLVTLLKRHKNAAHVYLILEAQYLLEQAGFTCERFPEPLETDWGRYEPDLVAHFAGQTLYIEAERQTAKKAADRQRKWERYVQVTNGQLFLAVVDQQAQRALASELARHLGAKFRYEAQWLVADHVRDQEHIPHGWDIFI